MDISPLLNSILRNGGFLAYPLLQLDAIRHLEGGWKKLAMLPLLAMIPTYVILILGLFPGSNLWRMLMLLATPVFCPYLAILLIAHAWIKRKERRAQ